jgi:hypothetical protein
MSDPIPIPIDQPRRRLVRAASAGGALALSGYPTRSKAVVGLVLRLLLPLVARGAARGALGLGRGLASRPFGLPSFGSASAARTAMVSRGAARIVPRESTAGSPGALAPISLRRSLVNARRVAPAALAASGSSTRALAARQAKSAEVNHWTGRNHDHLARPLEEAAVIPVPTKDLATLSIEIVGRSLALQPLNGFIALAFFDEDFRAGAEGSAMYSVLPMMLAPGPGASFEHVQEIDLDMDISGRWHLLLELLSFDSDGLEQQITNYRFDPLIMHFNFS